jgi:hypothetical protein
VRCGDTTARPNISSAFCAAITAGGVLFNIQPSILVTINQPKDLLTTKKKKKKKKIIRGPFAARRSECEFSIPLSFAGRIYENYSVMYVDVACPDCRSANFCKVEASRCWTPASA